MCIRDSLLVTMMMFVAVTALPLIMILMVGFILLLMAVYYISLSVTALRGKMGLGAYRYAAAVVRRRMGTVSYTHLDVYKRQPHC